MQLKIGILSAALISGDFVNSLKTLNQDEIKVVAVAATSLKSAQDFATKHNISRAYGSYHELMQDKDVQLVYIGARNIYHYSAAKLAIESGKHCIIEKPMTIESDTTQELFDLGKKNGVFVMEAMWSQFVPAYVKIREIIKSGQIGDIVHVQANFVMSSTKERVVLKKFGGGCLFDIGVYALHAIFTGTGYTAPKSMKAFGRLHSPDDADVNVSATFDFPGTTTATMILTAQADSNNLSKMNHVLYIGTKGYIKISGFINNPAEIEVNGQIIDTNSDDKQGSYNWGNSHGLRFQALEARSCIMEKKLQSEVHGEKHSMLLINTITKLMDDVGYSVKGLTPKDGSFKNI